MHVLLQTEAKRLSHSPPKNHGIRPIFHLTRGSQEYAPLSALRRSSSNLRYTTRQVSGKGGWDSQNFEMAVGDVNGQIELAFKNLDLALKHAGLKGWENVDLIRMYHTDIDSSIKQIAEAT